MFQMFSTWCMRKTQMAAVSQMYKESWEGYQSEILHVWHQWTKGLLLFTINSINYFLVYFHGINHACMQKVCTLSKSIDLKEFK